MRRTRTRGPADWVVGAAVLAAAIVATFFAFAKEVPFRSHTELRAAFADATGLRKGVPVRVAGVTVGEVREVQRDGTTALATLRMRDEGLPIHADAEVKLRPRLFFEGSYFVDVEPGSPSARVLGDGEVIGIGQTGRNVAFDEVLGLLDRSSRDDLGTILTEYGRAVRGSAKAVNATIPDHAPAYRDAAIVAAAQQGERPGTLARYLRGGADVAAALDRDPAALQSLLRDLRITAGAFAGEAAALERTLTALPPLLRTGTPALADLDRALPPLRRLTGELRRAARTAPPALDAGLALAKQLRGLVRPGELRGLARDLRTAAPELAGANAAGPALSEQLRLLSSCQNRVALPTGNATIPDAAHPAPGRVFEETAWVLPGLAGESRSGDANGQWFRVYVTSGNEAYALGDGRVLLTDRPIQGTNPPVPARFSPLRPDVPCETQEPPDLRTVPGAPPQRLAMTPDPVREAKAAAVASRRARRELDRDGLQRLRIEEDLLTPDGLGRLAR